MYQNKSIVKTFLLLAFIAVFAGCASKPDRIYAWGSYEENLYQYFNKDDADAQVMLDKMENELDTILSSDKNVPPGMYAFMGLLYEKIGSRYMMVQSFQMEQALFPESAEYIDFLTRNIER